MAWRFIVVRKDSKADGKEPNQHLFSEYPFSRHIAHEEQMGHLKVKDSAYSDKTDVEDDRFWVPAQLKGNLSKTVASPCTSKPYVANILRYNAKFIHHSVASGSEVCIGEAIDSKLPFY